MSDGNGQPSAARLISQTLAHLMAILRGEIALAKAEARETAALIGAATGMIVFAAVLAVVALNTLVEAVIIGLVQAGMSELAATVVVGAVLVILALILFFVARARFQAVSQSPKRVASNLRRDAAAVKGGTTDV